MKKIPDDTLKTVCKMGQGHDCCRYIIVDPKHGIVCAKGTKWQMALDERVEQMVTQGDNCKGLKSKKVKNVKDNDNR